MSKIRRWYPSYRGSKTRLGSLFKGIGGAKPRNLDWDERPRVTTTSAAWIGTSPLLLKGTTATIIEATAETSRRKGKTSLPLSLLPVRFRLRFRELTPSRSLCEFRKGHL